MLALLISIAISVAFMIVGIATHLGKGASVSIGVVSFVLLQVLIGFITRKKTEKVKHDLEGILMAGQKRINRKVQQFQQKPGANPKAMQRTIEQDQKEVFTKILDFLVNFEPIKKWNVLMGRQILTMRLQFLYQLKEFEQVDALLAGSGIFKGPMMMEPLLVAMKMARQYQHKDNAGAEKTFKTHIKWFRGARGTLLYGLMSWIYMKDGQSEKARQLLLTAKDITANETLARNWELLSNCKDQKFSNAGLGEEWFGLYLESPPAPKQQRQRGNQGQRRF